MKQSPGLSDRYMGSKAMVGAVPIDSKLSKEILAHAKLHDRTLRIFDYAMSAFREGIECAGIALPAGQMTHVLRHTFASHFMINGGNILTLQRILGHANLTMTMRYADDAVCAPSSRTSTRGCEAKSFSRLRLG